ncbi:MAG: transglutaminase-like cysteine peptidase [Burkholderiaceae bacterium]
MVFFLRSSAARRAAPGQGIRPRLAARWLAGLLLGLLGILGPCMGLDNARLLEAAARLGPHAAAEAPLLLQTIARAALLDEDQRLALVNDFFNQHIAFKDDLEVWGKIDYWASPLESLGKGAGDCEDYAIAKYFSLVAAGMPVARLRMVYVRAMVGGRSLAHMVLAYYAQPGAEPLILDNLIPELRPASRRPDLQPVFSFNSEGLWQGVGNTSNGDPLVRLSQWRDLIAKVRAEGF